jgi:hypothetical protein
MGKLCEEYVLGEEGRKYHVHKIGKVVYIILSLNTRYKEGDGKFQPRTGHEDTERE